MNLLSSGFQNYVLKRILQLPIIVFALLVVTFTLSRIIPADVLWVWAGPFATKESKEAIIEHYHLAEPLYVQFWYYFQDLLRFDLGNSPITHRPITLELAIRFPRTIQLTFFALFLSVIGGLTFGVVSAIYRNKLPDHFTRLFALAGLSMPLFWFGLLLQLFFHFKYPIFPAIGVLSGEAAPIVTRFDLIDSLLAGRLDIFWDAVMHLILPSFCLSYPYMAIITRITRSEMLEVLGQDYIRAARSKGLSERVIMFRHALRNGIIPSLTLIGMTFGFLLGGSVLIETVFVYPGMGYYVVTQAIKQLDYPAIMGVTLVAGLVFILVNLAVDLLYGYIDPRIRLN